jgi:hypothetical protein
MNIRREIDMSILQKMITVLALSSALFLFGCGGGGADIKNSSTTTTLGQELKDLKDAHDQKIISDSEYEDAKDRIIRQRTDR